MTPHLRRPALASRFPVHVSLRVEEELPSLRQDPLPKVIEEALRAGREAEGFRLAHYSIQKKHLHLIVEAASAERLSRGMQGLSIRLAKRINKALGRKGRVFGDRYFERILKTPKQTRYCIQYVLNNSRRHCNGRGDEITRGWIDEYSSGPYFDGWRDARPQRLAPSGADPPVAKARTWMLTVGWRRHGLIPVNAVPGPHPYG